MKPKAYRKQGKSKPSKMIDYKVNSGGGTVTGITIGPESSTGTTSGSYVSKPSVEQGKEKGIKTI
jgi:hypothetical protein